MWRGGGEGSCVLVVVRLVKHLTSCLEETQIHVWARVEHTADGVSVLTIIQGRLPWISYQGPVETDARASLDLFGGSRDDVVG